MQSETAKELSDLVEGVVIDEGSWLCCPVCGTDFSPIGLDDDRRWCQTCNARVRA